jgi:hypothetical protein
MNPSCVIHLAATWHMLCICKVNEFGTVGTFVAHIFHQPCNLLPQVSLSKHAWSASNDGNAITTGKPRGCTTGVHHEPSATCREFCGCRHIAAGPLMKLLFVCGRPCFFELLGQSMKTHRACTDACVLKCCLSCRVCMYPWQLCGRLY